MSAAWFCPSCQKYHAPHCDTCPGPEQAVRPLDTRPVILPRIQPYTPLPDSAPWVPFYPTWTAVADCSMPVSSATVICINGHNPNAAGVSLTGWEN